MNILEKAYDPETVRLMGEQMAARLADYYKSCQALDGPTVPSLDPARHIEIASKTLQENGSEFEHLVAAVMGGAHRLHDPRYMGHQVPPAVPAAAFFDTLGRASNQGAAVFEMAPFGTAAEKAVIKELGQLVGWADGSFAGIATHGGTLANVTALLAARNIRYQSFWREGRVPDTHLRPAVMTSADSHYCIARACGILGIGTSQLLKVPVDKNRRMNLQLARQMLKDARKDGLDVFAIVGSACTTPTGSFDDLAGIAELALENKLWFHVDGAHGASFLMSSRHRGLLSGIELADSIAWDAHKMLYVPALCTYLLYKNSRHSWEAFSQDAPYLFDPDDPQGMAEFDGGLRTFECTKGAISLGLWGIWSLYGKNFFATLLDKAMENTQTMYQLISEAKDFEAAHDPQCNILCFRYAPSHEKRLTSSELSNLQQNIRRQLLARGHGYITATRIDEEHWLRVTVINPQTDRSHLVWMLNQIRSIGLELSR